MQKQLRYLLTLLLLAITSVGWADGWEKTAPADLKTDDIVVIVDETTNTAMSNDKGTSAAPSAVAFDATNVGDNIKWEVTVDGDNYQFKVPGTSNYLYCTNNNNGLRVGTNTNNVFTIYENNGVNFLLNSGQSRYVGVYNNQDWRSYTSINNNIKECVTVFYKYSGVVKKTANVAIGATSIEIGKTTQVTTDGPSLTLSTSDASIASVSGTTVKGVAAGTATITASWNESSEFFGGTKTFTVNVIDINAPGSTADNPYTVAQARAAIVANTGITGVYVKGIVSEIVTPFNSQFGNISYNISDDGTTTADQLQAYRGKGIDGANFTSADDVLVGDEVVIYGNLKKYNDTYEFDANNQLVSIVHKGKPAAGLAYATAEVSKQVGDAAFTNELTNPNSVTVTYSSSDETVATVNSSGLVTIKGAGTTTITATFAGNSSYAEGSASYTLTVTDPNAPGSTADNPYTVAQAITAINALADGGYSATEVYVKGIISKIQSLDVSKYERAQYFISDDGTETNQLLIYNGYYLDNVKFTANDQIAVGDEVIVYGKLQKYVKNDVVTPEIAQNNYIVSLKHSGKESAGLAYATTTVEKNVGDDPFTNPLTNPNNLTVTYSSSEEGVATVDANGEVTVLGAGTTIITASSEETDEFEAGEASYTLTVSNNVTVIDLRGKTEAITFDPLNQFIQGSGYKSYETAQLTGSDGVTYAGWSAENVMTGEKTGLQMKASVGKLTSPQILSDKGVKIEITKNEATQANTVTITADEVSSDEGSLSTAATATSFTLAAGEKYAVVMSITITPLTGNEKLPAGLSYSETKFEGVAGESFTAPTLNNPNNLTVTYTSSDEEVATVNATTGEVSLKGAGNVTITATFAGNDSYESGSASYSIEVKEPVISNGNVYTLVTDASALAAGDVILFAGDKEGDTGTTYYAMSNTEKTSNFDAVEVEGDGTTIKGNSSLQEITLEGEAGAWLFKVGEKYLYASSSTKNELKAKAEIDENGNSNATITIDDNGAAIVFNGTNTRKYVRFNYNNGKPIINCYADNDMPNVKIYRKSGGELGDVNYSGKVDVTDAMLVVDYILTDSDPSIIKKGYEHYDIDKNGTINVTDVMLIVQIILEQK